MPPNRSVESHHFEALGTSCSIFAVDQSHGRLLEGEFWVRRLGARLTRFSPDSELSKLNAAAGLWMEVSEEMESLLETSLDAYAMSGGLVNVAVLMLRARAAALVVTYPFTRSSIEPLQRSRYNRRIASGARRETLPRPGAWART